MGNLKINVSSLPIFIWPDGDRSKEPIRGRSDADCVVFINIEQNESGGENGSLWNRLKYNDKAVVKYRKGWDEISDAYDPIKTYEHNVS